MIRQLSRFLWAFSTVCVLALCGCGKNEAPQSTTVIQPAAEKNETSTAQPPASPETAGEPAHAAQTEPTPAAAEAAPPQAAPPHEPTPEVAATPSEPHPAAPATEPPSAESTAPSKPVEVTSAKVAGGPPASVALGAEPGGTVFKGRVVVKGTPTKPKPIKPEKDPVCIALKEIPDESLVVGEGGGLANVFVWLQKVPSGAKIPDVPAEPASLDNHNCRFEPHAFVLRVGQKMFIKNSDPTGHNTHTSPIRNNAFNQLIGANDKQGAEVVYGQTETVPITTKCDIHPWMASVHLPVPHPWAAVTDEHGNFEITGLPAGELDFRLWHERTGYVERSVKLTIPEGQTVERTFEVDAAKLEKK